MMEPDPTVDPSVEPDWDVPVQITLTPAAIMHTLFATADSVHTGWDTCIDHTLAVAETTALDEDGGNYARLVKQEYVEGEETEVTWHDWAVELKIAEVYITAHWRTQENASPADWDWCATQAENAFASACVLVGRRVRRGLVMEEASHTPRTPRTHH